MQIRQFKSKFKILVKTRKKSWTFDVQNAMQLYIFAA